MGKVEDYFNRQSYENLLNYSKECIYLLDTLWDMANKNQINAIDKALSEVYKDKTMQSNKGPLSQLTYEQISAHFHKEKITVYEKIPERASLIMRERISKLIKKNLIYSRKLDLDIPENDILSIYQCYYNYNLLKIIVPQLESIVSVKKR